MFNWFTGWKDAQLFRFICKVSPEKEPDYSGMKKSVRLTVTSDVIDGIVETWLKRQSAFTRRFYTPPKFKYVTSGDKVRICMYR